MNDSHANHDSEQADDLAYAMRREFSKEIVALATVGGEPAARAYRRKAYTYRDELNKVRGDSAKSHPTG